MQKRKISVSAVLGVLLAVVAIGTGLVVNHAKGNIAPTISTDKTKYSVGETMIITGTGFSTGGTVDISVLRPSHDTDNFSVTTDSSGGFSTNYTPSVAESGRFKITATDGTNSAKTAATEADAIGINVYSQCANDTGDGYTGTDSGCHWTNGDLNGSNSAYHEGDATVQRLEIDGLAGGTTNHTVTIEYELMKGGKHAYDYLTDDRFSEKGGNYPVATVFGTPDPDLCDSPVTTSGCSTAVPNLKPIPQPGVSGISTGCEPLTHTTGNFAIRGGTITSVGNPQVVSGSSTCASGDVLADVQITYSTNPGATAVLITFGAHVSCQFSGTPGCEHGWGAGTSAVSINGSPYHVKVVEIEGKNVSSRDNQMSATAVLQQGTLQIIKRVINDNGGTSGVSAFGLSTTAGSLTFDGGVADGANTTKYTSQAITVNTGSYTLRENDIAGYSEGTWSCTGATPSDTSINNGAVTVPAGTAVVCTITNNDIGPTLKLVKTVINNNGGSAVANDWDLAATGTGGFTETTPASADATFHGVTAGINYTLSESGPSGYTASSWSCDGGTQSTNHIQLALGQNVTCTITNNDDAPALHLRKIVTNNNGGTATVADFTLTADGTDSNDLSGTSPVDSGSTLKADTFALSETSLAGYASSSWSCVGGTQNGSNITLGIGDEATCTITNDDQPGHLIVHKVTVPANDLTVFSVTLSDTPVSGSTTRDLSTAADVNYEVNAGTYSVAEAAKAGWSETGNTCVDVVVALGATEECTITNTELGSISGKKYEDMNGDGSITGDPTLSGWTIKLYDTATTPWTLVDTKVTDGTGAYSFTNLLPASYKVCEVLQAGWTKTFSTYATSPNPDNANELCQTASLSVGSNDTRNFGNFENPILTVIKHVINNNGGTAVAGDFNLHVKSSGTDVTNSPAAGSESGTEYTLIPGTYTVSEDAPVSGYTNITDNTNNGDCDASNAVTLQSGDSKTCTITNDDDAPSLKLIKHVINDNGGTATASDWTLSAGTHDVTGSETAVEATDQAGTYALSETSVANYTNTSITCDNNPGTEVTSVTIGLGETITCTFVNDDDAPALHLRKIVTNNNGGTATVADFTLTADGTGSNDLSGTSPVDSDSTLKADTFALSETSLAGYASSSWSCVGGTQNGSNITLGIGDEATCTITNDDISPVLTIVKDADPNDCQDFNFSMTGITDFLLSDHDGVQECVSSTPQSKTFDDLQAGQNLTVTETLPNEFWAFVGASCVVTGTDTPYTSTVVTKGLTVNLGLADDVTCTFNNHKVSPTRTLGFWKTHTAFTESVFHGDVLKGSITLGDGGQHQDPIITDGELFGAWYSNVSQKSTGKGKDVKRSDVDQARMQLAWQWLAADLNCAAFGCSSSIQTLLNSASTAYASGNINLMHTYASQLDAFNNSGDTIVLPPLPTVGKATPKDSQSIANLTFWDTP